MRVNTGYINSSRGTWNSPWSDPSVEGCSKPVTRSEGPAEKCSNVAGGLNCDSTIFPFSVPEENIATTRHGAQVIRGEMKAALLDGDVQNYDLDRGFTRHPIDDNNGQGIAVKLGQPYIINTVKMLLWDRDMRWVLRCAISGGQDLGLPWPGGSPSPLQGSHSFLSLVKLV